MFYAIHIACRLPKPAVVSSQDPFETGLIAWVIARMSGAPLHVQVHTDFFAPTYARHSLLNRLRVRLARFVLKRASRVRVVSQRIKDSLKAGSWKLEAEITVLPIYTDIEHVGSATPDAACADKIRGFATKLLVVAGLEPEKNVALAIEAFATAAPERACLIIVGDGCERSKLERRVRERGISGRVFFEGGRDATPYYPLADLVLVTSAYEGYGLVIVEALARGVPVISTDVGIAHDAGAIITSVEQFAQTLSVWFKNGPREMHLNAYPYKDFNDYVRKYTDDICATRRG